MILRFAVAAAVALSWPATAGFAQTAAETLQKGIYTQQTAGNVDGAIQTYRQATGMACADRVDIMLPRVNGYEICRDVRARGLEMPILMLTAKGQEEDIVLGLNLGADDYIAKPFRRGELIARVNAFLRRSRFNSRARP